MCLFLLPVRSCSTPFCSWTQLRTALPSELTTFPQFSLLPIEIRLQIWSKAARLPRLVHIEERTSSPHGIVTTHFCSNPIPAILHVCSESRNVALPLYSLLFANDYPSDIGPLDHPSDPWWGSIIKRTIMRPKPCYFNYSLDTFQYNVIRIHTLQNLWPLDVQDLANVKRLALSNYQWKESRNSAFYRDLPLFKAVEEIVLVVDDCRGRQIETLRTHPNSDLPEWSEDGKMMMFRTGRLREKFKEEMEMTVPASSGWRPNVLVEMFVDRCTVEVLSS